MDDTFETTLRARVDGANLGRVKLPDPVVLTAAQAGAVAAWARPFSGVAIADGDIHVGDIKPASAMRSIGDLDPRLAARIGKLIRAAETYGFAMRLARETTNEPYTLEIVRRVIDPKQLTVKARSMRIFLQALKLAHNIGEDDLVYNVDAFAETLARRLGDCCDAGVAHYHGYAMQIVAFARSNGATEIICGRERRGAVAAAA